MNVESLFIAELKDATQLANIQVLAEVPKHRPDSFITVERTGGGHEGIRDLPLLTVHVWESTRFLASELASSVSIVLKNIAVTHPDIALVSIESIYNDPDVSGHQRYRITSQIVVKNI